MLAKARQSGKSVPSSAKQQAIELGSRISTAVDRIGSLVQAGKVAGVTDEAVARWRDGLSKAPFDGIVRLCQASNLSLEWMATGQGHRDADQQGGNVLQQEITGDGSLQALTVTGDNEMVFIPRLEVEAAAGAGAVVEHERVAEMMGFSEDWLRARHITPAAARIVTARGDSMEPTIRDGDFLIVDTAISEAVDNGLYVLTFNGVVLVKRLFIMRNGGLVISSDNKIAGRDEEIPPHEVPEIRIAGRVMWYGRTI